MKKVIIEIVTAIIITVITEYLLHKLVNEKKNILK